MLEAISELFPKAPIYTLFYDPEKTFFKFARRTVITSPLQNIPLVKTNHRFFIPLMPLAVSFLDARPYDLVISSSASYAKGVRSGSAYHLCYCHTPLRYAWEDKEYLVTHPALQSFPMKIAGSVLAAYLRRWDRRASKKPNLFIANSRFIADKISRFYGRDAAVMHPPVDTSVFYPERGRKRNYFLAVGRFLHYKRFDVIIEAFNKLDEPLVIIGSGPEEDRLKRMVWNKSISFVPYVEDERDLRFYYNGARALLFPQVEDFGLTAAEAIACGTPVVAYRAGGAVEIVREGISGLFFDEQTPEAIREAVKRFKRTRFDSRSVAKEGRRFSKERFQKEFSAVLSAQGFLI